MTLGAIAVARSWFLFETQQGSLVCPREPCSPLQLFTGVVRRQVFAVNAEENIQSTFLGVGNVVVIENESGPPQIRREDVQRRVVIQANVEGRDMGGLVAELQQRIAKEIKLPPGYTVVYGGQFENQQRAQARLMIVVPLSLGLIFLLLYLAFSSVGQALLIMLNVPLALIGGIAALYFSGQYLSIPSSIGFIALFGVAVLNGHSPPWWSVAWPRPRY